MGIPRLSVSVPSDKGFASDESRDMLTVVMGVGRASASIVDGCAEELAGWPVAAAAAVVELVSVEGVFCAAGST